MSAGYYNEHTKQEYINLNDLQNTIDLVIAILKDEENRKSYDYQEIRYYSRFPAKESTEKTLMRSDYKNLSDKEFLDYYGIYKPKTEEDLETTIDEYFGY